ncbi:MAG: DUF2332 family protein [Myxococcales bacterium]|nr:DUF2332 domain-containing protein [Myxococcota bacterium]MDW8280843.1 DUF2332 family protein [Myxococcales bacterium]
MVALSRGELLAGFRLQIAMATGRSPLTAAVLRAHLRALEARGLCALGEELLARLAHRPSVHPLEAPLLAAAAVHYQVLAGPAHAKFLERLRALYPSVGGSFHGRPDEERALVQALEEMAQQGPAPWRRFLSEGRVQTHAVERSVCWLEPARALQARRPLPLDLVELGTGSGLLLVADQLTPDGAALRVSRRLGVDLCPVDVADGHQRLGLRACVWADQLDRLARLDAAVERLLALRHAGDGPELYTGDMVEMLPALIRRLRGGQTPRRLIVFNALSTVYLDDEAYSRLQARIRAELAAWPGPALWVELEPERHGSATYLVLSACRVRSGALERLVLGRLPPHPEPGVAWDRPASAWTRLLEEPQEGWSTSIR